MMNDRLTVQRDQRDGGWYVVVDGATKHFDTRPEAVKVACMELAAFEELSAMNADALENIESLQRTLEIERRKAVELRNRLNDDEQPTLSTDEVRGVVHCGECKFWRRPPSCEGLARCETGETGIRYRSKNDFCSRGARMKGAEDGSTDMER